MASGSAHALAFSGIYAGVPIAFGIAYEQLGDGPASGNPGRDLITSWCNQPAGPWQNLAVVLDSTLQFDCASSSHDDRVETVFLSGCNGDNVGSSLPSTHAIQFNFPFLNPYDPSYEGRMFIPGIPSTNTLRSGFTANMNSQLVVVCAALLEIDSLEEPGAVSYRLMPHAKALNQPQVKPAQAYLPYVSEFVKVIGNRRSDQCSAFTGGGTGGFAPIVVP